MTVLSWSPTTWRKVEAVRDRIFRGVGTDEPLIAEDLAELAAAFGRPPCSMQWRKPLSISEVNRMAQTPEVRARQGRP